MHPSVSYLTNTGLSSDRNNRHLLNNRYLLFLWIFLVNVRYLELSEFNNVLSRKVKINAYLMNSIAGRFWYWVQVAINFSI